MQVFNGFLVQLPRVNLPQGLYAGLAGIAPSTLATAAIGLAVLTLAVIALQRYVGQQDQQLQEIREHPVHSVHWETIRAPSEAQTPQRLSPEPPAPSLLTPATRSFLQDRGDMQANSPLVVNALLGNINVSDEQSRMMLDYIEAGKAPTPVWPQPKDRDFEASSLILDAMGKGELTVVDGAIDRLKIYYRACRIANESIEPEENIVREILTGSIGRTEQEMQALINAAQDCSYDAKEFTTDVIRTALT